MSRDQSFTATKSKETRKARLQENTKVNKVITLASTNTKVKDCL